MKYQDIEFVGVIIGMLLILASFFYGTRFFPPGEGYAQEKREMRISMIMMILGFVFIGASVIDAMVRSQS